MQEETNKKTLTMWEKTGLLGGVSGKFQKEQLALVLENQRLYNQDTELRLDWHKISIPIVTRVFSNLAAFDLISIQTLDAKDGSIKFKDQYGFLKIEKLEATTKAFKSYYCSESQYDGHGGPDDLEPLVRRIAELSEEIILEVTQEITGDLITIAATTVTHKWKSPIHLLDIILLAASRIKVGSGANWISVSPEILDELKKLPPEEFVASEQKLEYKKIMRYAGKLSNRWKVFVDPLMDVSTILLGYKGTDEYQVGYVYSPYIALIQKPIVLDKDTFCPREGFLISYSKKLVNADYYGKIVLEDYVGSEGDDEESFLEHLFLEQTEEKLDTEEEVLEFELV